MQLCGFRFFSILDRIVIKRLSRQQYGNAGYAGTLDPVTGEEDFKEINRLGVPHWHPDAFLVPFAPITKFNGDALARGAKTGATLKLDKVNAADGQEIRIDKSPDSAWTWTGIGRPPKNVKFN
jgi:hypothetical protein